jgi:hypothetical protein
VYYDYAIICYITAVSNIISQHIATETSTALILLFTIKEEVSSIENNKTLKIFHLQYSIKDIIKKQRIIYIMVIMHS